MMHALQSLAILLPLALIGGCSGIVAGKSSPQSPAPQSYSVSGTISPAGAGSGTTVTLSGPKSAATVAGSSGSYTFPGLANGSYAVTPSRAGYTFGPATQAATVNGASVTGINFTATARGANYNISGTITPAAGGSRASVTLSGSASATVVTNSSGNYTFAGLGNGTYAVTPANSGYTSSPVSQSVTINTATVTGVNFTAAGQIAHSVVLTWGASASTVSGYNVYRSTVAGTAYSKINSGLVPILAYTHTTVQNGTTYYYVTTALDGGGNRALTPTKYRRSSHDLADSNFYQTIK